MKFELAMGSLSPKSDGLVQLIVDIHAAIGEDAAVEQGQLRYQSEAEVRVKSWLRTRHSLGKAIGRLKGLTGDVWLKIRHMECGKLTYLKSFRRQKTAFEVESNFSLLMHNFENSPQRFMIYFKFSTGSDLKIYNMQFLSSELSLQGAKSLSATDGSFNSRLSIAFETRVENGGSSSQNQTASLLGPLRAAADCASQRQRQAVGDAKLLAEAIAATDARLDALQRRHDEVSNSLAEELSASEQRQAQLDAGMGNERWSIGFINFWKMVGCGLSKSGCYYVPLPLTPFL